MASKTELRKQALSARKEIADRERRSFAICDELERLPFVRSARVVMLYAAIGEEIDLWPLAERANGRGALVAFPVCLTRSKELEPRRVVRREDLRVATFGIPEPGPKCQPVDPGEIDVVVVPGLLFDRRGHRIGYGAGYYDRFLKRVRPDCVKIGVVYSELLWDELPTEPLDVPVDWIVTEQGARAAAR